MRITQNMVNQMALNGLQTNMERMSKLQEQAVTSKRINQPEDDPSGVEQALAFRARLNSGDALLKSLSATMDWLNATDKALGDMAELMTRSQSLALRGSNDTLGADERQSLAAEVDGLLEESVGVGNTRHGDQYLFAGFKVDTAPFEVVRDPVSERITSAAYVGDSGLMMREAEPGTDVAINIIGDPLFSDTIATLVELRDALMADPFVANDVSDALSDIKDQENLFLNQQASTGAAISRMESTSDRLESAQIGLRELLSKTEDADMAEVISQLAQQQYVYQTALEMNGQILRLSLLDFLD
jgi:flagellar hook-associated protein 3 FlgL